MLGTFVSARRPPLRGWVPVVSTALSVAIELSTSMSLLSVSFCVIQLNYCRGLCGEVFPRRFDVY